MSESYAPMFKSDSFYCPHCKVYAHQVWEDIESEYLQGLYDKGYTHLRIDAKDLLFSICAHCEKPAFWLSEKMVFPDTGAYPLANTDMPDTVTEVYDEAGAVAHLSPRAACALLRLALQMLLVQLGESGDINRATDNLAKNGLDPEIKKAMHILRVTGNHAIHPGEISFDSDTDTDGLFRLLNAIVYDRITISRERAEMYNSLPKSDREFIAKSDSKTKR